METWKLSYASKSPSRKFITNIDKKCSFCSVPEESIVHIFWECDIAKSIWLDIQDWLEINLNDIKVGSNLVVLKVKFIPSPEKLGMW